MRTMMRIMQLKARHAHVSKLARKVGRVSRVPGEKQLSLFLPRIPWQQEN